MKSRLYLLSKWLLPITLLATIAPFTPKLDLFFSNYFFDGSSFSKHLIHYYIFNYATWPAMGAAITAGAIFIISYLNPKYHHLRLTAFFIGFVMALGPGLMAQWIMKGFVARPRPVHLVNFGGLHSYVPFFSPVLKFPNTLKSFPSGHSTMGFYFICFTVLGQRFKNSHLKFWGIFLTLVLGFILSISRIAQGAHFFSDVLSSFCLLWYSSLISDWIVFEYLAKNKLLRYTKK